MNQTHQEPVESTAAIAGHPLHPIMITFPIAFLTGALVTDVVYAIRKGIFWARMSFWLITGGLVTGVAAAALGLLDFVTIRRARTHTGGWVHALGNAAVLMLSASNLVGRIPDPRETVIPGGVILSAVSSLILGVTGWFGGEMVFRHKIGVTGHEQNKQGS